MKTIQLPKHSDLATLETFLNGCERAAVPWVKGMPDTVVTPRVVTLEDLLGLNRRFGDQLPFEAIDRMPDDRAGRLALLHKWLRLLPRVCLVARRACSPRCLQSLSQAASRKTSRGVAVRR